MKLKAHLIIAAIVALIIVLLELVLYRSTGRSLYSGHYNYVYIAYAVLGGGILLGTYLFAKTNGNGLPFGQYFFNAIPILALSLLLIIGGRIIIFHATPGMIDNQLKTVEKYEITRQLTIDSTQRYQLAHQPADAPPPPAGTVDTASREKIVAGVKNMMAGADKSFNIQLMAGTIANLAIQGILAIALSSLIFARRRVA